MDDKAKNIQSTSSSLRTIPIVAVRGVVVFPHTDPVLSFGRKKSVDAITKAFQEDRIVAVFTQKNPKVADPGIEDLYSIGTIVTITQMMTTEGEVHSVVHGQARVKLEEIVAHEPYLVGRVSEVTEELKLDAESEALANKVAESFKKAINLGKQAEIMTVMKLVSGRVEPLELADQVASLLEIKVSEKQKLLENFSLIKRLSKIYEYIQHEVSVLDLERNISSKTQKRFEEQMRMAMLREKKKTIEKELGEEESEWGSDDIKAYKTKIINAKMPEDVRKKAEKELKRLMGMNPQNPETGYIRNYLDWLCDMPWSIVSPNNIKIADAEKVLDDDHYGLEKVKERILEYLAVMQIKKHGDSKDNKKSSNNDGKKKYSEDSQPTILCFIGPPGVGKTSLGKSIAKALGRKFVRISLGGIRDEAEIRGHRRTYVGAMPGRIIQGIKNAGTTNPIFMLDEIDKIGADFRGDPSSALLEALDPEQNSEFSDHYLEVPFDLSKVMFIATGNVLETIPDALRDRMEVINFSGYTLDEKYFIAEKYLWPKQLRVHGIENKKIKLQKEGLMDVITSYTRESGVRNLERALAKVCRKVARMVAEKNKYPAAINKVVARKLLGSQRITSQIAEKKDEVGMATGLAVTRGGGDILFIEVALMPGKGILTLTGQLGEVMKESAKAAFTWAKSHWKELGLKESFGSKTDVHIHVPEGAVKKDGPSAGVSISTALVSALTRIPVKRDVGMTGEVTLRGRVLEIGGVKEKVIAGHRAGLKTIILPRDNKKDYEDIPANVRKDLNIIFASELSQVLENALSKNPFKK